MSLTDLFRGKPDEFQALGNEYAGLRAAAQERIERMKRYREENEASRKPDMQLDTADLRDYGRISRESAPRRHNIPLPLGMALNVKHAYRIAGRLPDVIVDRRDESPQEVYRSDVMEKIVWAILRESDGETQFADAAWDASGLGAACFDMYWDAAKQMPMLRAVDPTGIVEVQGVDDPHDFQRVYRAWDVPTHALIAQYRDQTFRGEPVSVNAIQASYQTGQTDMTTIVQMCDRNRLVRFVLGDIPVPLYEKIHDYGFTPYVVIPNLGPYRDVWGVADYELVRPLVHYMTALLSREADVLRAVANGTYKMKDAGQNAEQVQRTLRTGGIVPMKRDGELEPVEVPQMPTFEADHADRAMELFKMLGFAPDAAWGKPGGTSGTDRGLQLQPLLEFTAMKQSNWQRGLGRLFSMGYRMVEGKMTLSATYRGARHGVGNRRMPFQVTLGPREKPQQVPNPGFEPDSMESLEVPEMIELPRTPKDLFGGDYSVRFIWQNRIDPDDPAFVLSELNKFTSNLQSMRTTLERLGFQAPEDEMRQIEREAERFPWVNDGRLAMLMAQLRGNAQGSGGGAPVDTAGAQADALGMMGEGDFGADAGAAANPAATGQLYGGQ